MPQWLLDWLVTDAATVALRLALIVLLTLVANRALGLVLRQVERRLERTTADLERLGRLRTLLNVGRSTLAALILLISGLMALNALGINITPLLAGAGVAGLALSLGAQTLIKDFIGGALILIENQFTVGDVVRVGDVTGEVERITLRATYLRDVEGTSHLAPNGDMRLISNFTTEWARAVVDLDVDSGADMSLVMAALEGAGQKAQADPIIKDKLLEAPQTYGWLSMKAGQMQVRLTAKVQPGQQWAVGRVLRQYAVEALGAEGVRVVTASPEARPSPPMGGLA